jgi:hypothetical protein
MTTGRSRSIYGRLMLSTKLPEFYNSVQLNTSRTIGLRELPIVGYSLHYFGIYGRGGVVNDSIRKPEYIT